MTGDTTNLSSQLSIQTHSNLNPTVIIQIPNSNPGTDLSNLYSSMYYLPSLCSDVDMEFVQVYRKHTITI